MDLRAMSSSKSSTGVRLPYIRYYQSHYITQMRQRQAAPRISPHDPRVRSQPLRSGCAPATITGVTTRIAPAAMRICCRAGEAPARAFRPRVPPRPPRKESA